MNHIQAVGEYLEKNTWREQWRPIKGYEDRYAVSDHGRIKTLERKYSILKNGYERFILESVMKPMKNRCGHMHVYLYKGDGLKKKFYVHRLVATAFHPNPESLPVVDHKDNDKENNHASNLQWVTYSDNNKFTHHRRI